jgi:hypothetical protein
LQRAQLNLPFQFFDLRKRGYILRDGMSGP